MFKAVSPKIDIQKLEQEVLDFWRMNRVFHRTMEEREDGPRYVFYEGPPTANGQPGSRTTTRALWYNTRTEESEFIDPGSGIFVRPDTGYRLGRVAAPKEEPEPERRRPEPRLPARNDMERQGFTGQ